MPNRLTSPGTPCAAGPWIARHAQVLEEIVTDAEKLDPRLSGLRNALASAVSEVDASARQLSRHAAAGSGIHLRELFAADQADPVEQEKPETEPRADAETAENLRADYSSAEFGGDTYWYR